MLGYDDDSLLVSLDTDPAAAADQLEKARGRAAAARANRGGDLRGTGASGVAETGDSVAKDTGASVEAGANLDVVSSLEVPDTRWDPSKRYGKDEHGNVFEVVNPRFGDRIRNFTSYWNTRFENHYRFYEINFGEYNGCHAWPNNTDRTVLWFYADNHLRKPTHKNWKSFLEESSKKNGGCFFVVISTRAYLEHQDAKDSNMDAGTRKKHAGSYKSIVSQNHPVKQTLDKLKEIQHFFGNTNVAWFVAKRVREGSDHCSYMYQRWPASMADNGVAGTTFGRHVAEAHGIPTSRWDVVVKTRPDLWFASGFDAAEVFRYSRGRREELAFFLRQSDDYTLSGEDPGNQVYIHSRGLMERLCLHSWVAGTGGCPMCAWTYGPDLKKRASDPLAWSCGHETMRLALSFSKEGGRCFYASPREFGAAVIDTRSDNDRRIRVNGLALSRWDAAGCTTGRAQPVCGVTSLLEDVVPFYENDGNSQHHACIMGRWRGRKLKWSTHETNGERIFLQGPGFLKSFAYVGERMNLTA